MLAHFRRRAKTQAPTLPERPPTRVDASRPIEGGVQEVTYQIPWNARYVFTDRMGEISASTPEITLALRAYFSALPVPAKGEEYEFCGCGRPWDKCATRDGGDYHRDR